MRTNDRLQRALRLRHLGGGASLAEPVEIESGPTTSADLKLFAMTFAAGFLFTTIFLA
jgi:hypothetical protein